MERCEEGDFFEIDFNGVSGICNILIYKDDTKEALFNQNDMIKAYGPTKKISVPVHISGNYETTISGIDFKGHVSVKRIPKK